MDNDEPVVMSEERKAEFHTALDKMIADGCHSIVLIGASNDRHGASIFCTNPVLMAGVLEKVKLKLLTSDIEADKDEE